MQVRHGATVQRDDNKRRDDVENSLIVVINCGCEVCIRCQDKMIMQTQSINKNRAYDYSPFHWLERSSVVD